MTRKSEEGFSLLETMIAVSVLAITFVSLGAAVLTGVNSTLQQKERDTVRNQALRYMERLQKLSFGDFTDPAPDTSDLEQLFDDSAEKPDLTLAQVRTPVDDDGHMFRIAGFETRGTWEVRIDRDVNGNGVLDDEEDDFDDLLKIQILFEGQPILTTYRSKPAGTN
jgi:prepilin-type N-terminal cleavage/methylation domain-containing protein